MGKVRKDGRRLTKVDTATGLTLSLADWNAKYPEKAAFRTRNCKTAEVKQKVLGGLLGAGLEKKQALLAAGYSDKNTAVVKKPLVRETVAQARERLANTDGLDLECSVRFYKRVVENPVENTGDRIKAQKEIDRILGYTAPSRIEMSGSQNVAMLVGMLGQLQVAPTELLKMVEVEEAEIEED